MPLDEAKVLDLITSAGALSEKVAADQADRDKRAAAVEELIPDVIAALIAGDRIEDGDRAKMAKVLRDPVTTLRFIEKLAGHRTDAEALAIGQPFAEKAAAANGGYNSLTSPLVGVATTHEKESDLRFLRGLGIRS